MQENIIITKEESDFTVDIEIGDNIEISGKLLPYKDGRCTQYQFEYSHFVNDESESFYDENWEDIEEKVLNKFYNEVRS
jgi:hypothetical protein